jgi:serine/threonine-protein kinase RsbW
MKDEACQTTERQESDTAVTEPDGDIVAARVPDFRARLSGMVAAGTRHLTLDLACVQSVDSVGIGLLVSVHNSLRKAGGELKLIHVSTEILTLLQAMRINQHFSVSGNRGAHQRFQPGR